MRQFIRHAGLEENKIHEIKSALICDRCKGECTGGMKGWKVDKQGLDEQEVDKQEVHEQEVHKQKVNKQEMDWPASPLRRRTWGRAKCK